MKKALQRCVSVTGSIFCLVSIPALFLLHVHNTGCHDGMVSGLHAVSRPGRGSRRHRRMAVLRSRRVKARNQMPRDKMYDSYNQLSFKKILLRIPIAFDLLVLKRQWKSFAAWLAVALLLLLVRGLWYFFICR